VRVMRHAWCSGAPDAASAAETAGGPEQ
jgi:hypothetical protein